jgi:hypothetical protein
MGVNYISDSDGHKINPATEETQIDIEAMLNGLLTLADKPTDRFVTQKIIIDPDGVGKGVNQACKKVYIATDGSDVKMAIRDTVDEDNDADTNDFLLPTLDDALPVELMLNNAGRLRFYGTAAKIVYLLIRI